MADTLALGMFVQRKYERDNATQAYLQRKNERDTTVTLRWRGNVSLSVELVPFCTLV